MSVLVSFCLILLFSLFINVRGYKPLPFSDDNFIIKVQANSLYYHIEKVLEKSRKDSTSEKEDIKVGLN